MDSRKVHVLIHGQPNPNAGGSAPVNQNTDIMKPVSILNHNPQPGQIKSKNVVLNWDKIALGGVLLLVSYLIISTPSNKTSKTFSQRRKLQENESSKKDMV